MSDEKHRMRNFGIGYLLGLAGVRVPVAKRLPVAYLYNGVRLPKLPDINTVWTDKETYPVVCIVPWEVAGYKYAVYTCQSVSFNGTYVILKGGNGHYVIAENGAEWYDHPDYSAGASAACESAIWCNTDILNTDGTTYLAASDPIPVYE